TGRAGRADRDRPAVRPPGRPDVLRAGRTRNPRRRRTDHRPGGALMHLTDVTAAGLDAALRDPSVHAIRVASDHTALDTVDVAAASHEPKTLGGTGGATFLPLELGGGAGVGGYHGSVLPFTHAVAGTQPWAPGRATGVLLG